MKPLVLTFKGLRSYRDEQTIDLRDRTLVGIVGETGAGKSSILEALNFALFGDCTWEAGTHKILIAHGSDGTLSVSLTFQVSGRTWQVERSIASDRATSVHKLTCLDDGITITNRRAVDGRIVQIIGMDQDTFTKSVILPQGRFERLLHMSPKDRAGVLKKLLGIDDLDTIREQARVRHEQLLPSFVSLTERRDALSPDPRVATALAQQQLNAAESVRDDLQRAAATIATHAQQRAVIAAESVRIGAAQLGLNKAVAGHDIAEIKALVELGRRFDDDDRAAADEVEPIDAEAAEITARLGDRAPGQPNADQASSALISLHQLTEQHSAIDDTRLRVEAARQERDQLEATIGALNTTAEEATTAAEVSRLDAEGDAIAARQATDRADLARRRLANLREAGRILATARLRSSELTGRSQKADVAVIETAGRLADLAAQLEAAREQQTELQRLNAAAHAAEGLHPGDSCRVCSQLLAADFQPPEVAPLTATTKTVKRLEKEVAAAERDNANAQAEAGQVIRDIADADITLGSAVTAYAETIDEFAKVVDRYDLDADDAVILAGTRHLANEALATAAKSAEEHTRTTADAAGHQATAIAATAELKKHDAKLAADIARIAASLATIEESRSLLPSRYRPADESAAAIEAATAMARDDHDEQAASVARLGELHTLRTAATNARAALELRRDQQLRKPAARHFQKVQFVVIAHNALADLLSLPHAEAGDPAASVAAQADWTAATVERAESVRSVAAARARQLDTRVGEIDTEIELTLEKAPTEGRELAEAIAHAVGRAAVAAQRHTDLAAEIPLADDLQRRIDEVRPHMHSLKALVGLLSDAKFIGHVVSERQRTLLHTATTLLAGMTRRRFAFTEDFQIYDYHTGQGRDVKTMSGGETFQASLALALALVEQTALAGGRAEALFLDEGFGTLDRSALAEALEALQGQVRAGRLVVVISHLRAVTDHVTDLLLVERGPGGGSIARWADAKQRADIAEEDLYGGLHD